MRLRQVLVNLVGNSLKFTEKGEILVTVECREPEEKGSVLLEFTVKDTGIGIPEDKLDHLFQTFSQLHPAINRKYGGTGLGLAICKRLVELMGGTISVESTEHVGSTFRFSIPAGSPPDDSAAGNPNEAVTGMGNDAISSDKELAILIAEDHPVNRQLLLRMLERMGYPADAVGDGQEALEAVLRKRYDLILMDVQMPRMTGLQAAEAIGEQVRKGGGPFPVIVGVTAFAREEDKEACLAAGMKDFISKPIVPGKWNGSWPAGAGMCPADPGSRRQTSSGCPSSPRSRVSGTGVFAVGPLWIKLYRQPDGMVYYLYNRIDRNGREAPE
ncbi:ATP-binding protein [Paenibacillus sp. CC-CFT747]|nr:ATP-binding protein [Paenibacillus sp. CC-CFT747]